MSAAKITSKGQITIPKDIRSSLGLEVGDKVSFIIGSHGEVSFVPMTRDIRELKGIVSKPGHRVSIEDMNVAIKTKAGNLNK